VLVCCSGYAECDALLDMDEERIRRVMDTNYMGHVRNIKAVGPHLVKQKSGHICLVTSMAAITGFWGYGPYGASKAAIVQMAEALRQEMKEHGVGVTVFLPPTTDTPGLVQENLHKPDVLYVVESESAFNKTHPADDIARHLLDGIASNRFYKIATMDSWIQYVIVRKLTGLYHYLADGELRPG
jgi:NAD(P)-dependent dehydrogenase (short-subunit alcohol dehydrogenase family)